LRTHRSNIQRYRNLLKTLKTSLTELERQFVQKRLTEEQSNLESLATPSPMTSAGRKPVVRTAARLAYVRLSERGASRLKKRLPRPDG
jgi:hypothetical protein